jgi:lipopolysaccharide/colanic/teichoic acid biosynthesis glycosyltransferase
MALDALTRNRCQREESHMTLSRQNDNSNSSDPLLESLPSTERVPMNEEIFRRMIAVERKRTERSKAPFLLMLLEVISDEGQRKDRKTLDQIAAALLTSSRDTDLIGWYKDQQIVGAMFTGLVLQDKRMLLDTFLSKVTGSLREELTAEQFNQVSISFHLFPDDWDHDKPGRPSNAALYPDLTSHDKGRRSLLLIKRALDVLGSASLLLIFSPVFLAIALAVKASSKGPVFFRQQRVGRYGKTFTFLKFRSMYVDNDASVHKEFVTRMIASGLSQASQKTEGSQGVFKLTNDSRVTRIGRFLRRTSLDELPQFVNVLRGDMSLVGPRPPIPYELAAYQTWHRRRLLGVKPGITGLWQVVGRSRVQFDEMVRLDLRYASTWTPWLDIKILMRTPLAVIKGSGAY